VLLAAVPHALLGWPAIAAELRSAGVDPELVAGLAVGWWFGSAAMAALGIVVLVAAPEVARSAWAFRAVLAVGTCYLVFGLAALAYRFPHLHFLGFVALGAWILAAAVRTRRRAR
jgi:hypothetical protein